MLDIEDHACLVDYLVKKEWVFYDQNVTIEPLRGGVSCKVMKVSTGSNAFVVKQALPKLRVQQNWYSDIRRIIIERNGLDAYHRIVPESVPQLISYDDEHYLYVMEAAPSHAVSWKKKLLEGNLSFRCAEQAATSLAKVHSESSHNIHIMETFKNQQFFIELRIDPYLRTIRERHPSLESQIDHIINMLLENKLVLVHGDFSPKNILVSEERIHILDFEVAHLGHPSFDLAFFTNHLLLKSVKNKKWAQAYMNLMSTFVEHYFSSIDFMDATQLEKDTIPLLALLFLARVDGKSPAEYITNEEDKQLVRSLSYQILDTCQTYHDVGQLLTNHFLNPSYRRRNNEEICN